MGWGVRGDHRLLEFDGVGRVAGFHRGQLRFQSGYELQPFQPDPIPPLQHINISTNPRSQEIILTVQRIKGSNAGVSTFRCYPDTAADSHKDIIQRGTDIQTPRQLHMLRRPNAYPPANGGSTSTTSSGPRTVDWSRTATSLSRKLLRERIR
ncbi:hypothetical protein GCM10007170_00600 [Arthrobacter liuii]|uniref:Uncharacterized protein n=1 Tax=Arthrobacter liuii TaxID=1476996 RepID=A0ABQ2AF21_9MICC|nr:hypothetical protein GCM10007170_00600 [Arthrobacter liuii]